MTKPSKAPSGKYAAKGVPETTEVVRDRKTGKVVTVKGVGALKGSDFKIKKGVSLMRPIARQVLAQRSEKSKTG